MAEKRAVGAIGLALVFSILTIGASFLHQASVSADVKHESVETECAQQGCYRIRCFLGGEEYCIPSTSCYGTNC